MYDMNEWRPKVKSSWAKRGGRIFEGGIQKTSKYFQLVILIKQ